MRNRLFVVGATFAIWNSTAQACMNDRDVINTTINERSDVAVMLGLFPQFPKEYYQARIKFLNRHKKTLDSGQYDDLAVAYERIGDTATAIKVILEKRASPKIKLDTARGDDYGLSPEEYRDYATAANYGTFLVHSWIHGKRDRASRALLTEGIKELEAAVKINPDAHSGREWVQVDIVKWMLENAASPKKEYPKIGGGIGQNPLPGLVGLVELGSAWQSIDVFRMIALNASSSSEIGALARSRAKNLLDSGVKPLFNTPEPNYPEKTQTFNSKEIWVDTAERVANSQEMVKKAIAIAEKAKVDQDPAEYVAWPQTGAKMDIMTTRQNRPEWYDLSLMFGGLAIGFAVGLSVLSIVRFFKWVFARKRN